MSDKSSVNSWVQMPGYEAYKDSGVKWLGDIPMSWGLKKLKYEANVILGKMLCPEKKGKYQLKSYLKSKNIQWLNIDISSVDEMWFSKSEMDMYRLKKNDLIISEGGEVGKTCIWGNELDECYIQNSAHKVTFTHKNNSLFYLYLFYFMGKVGFFESIVNRVSIAHLTHDKLSNISLVFPSIEEQTAIAKFLDQKTTQIDQAIAIKEKQIALLKERKQILIQNAVTRGLDPNVPMKDSGVEWIGEIPAHWVVKRAKYIFDEIDERSLDGKEELLSVSHMTGVTPRSEKNVSMFMAEDYTGSKTCQANDLVFNIMWAWMGALGVSAQAGIVSSSYGIFRQKETEEFNSSFLEFLLKTASYIEHYNKISTGLHSSRLRFYAHMFFDMEMGFPDRDEQNEIVNHIEAQSSAIEKAINLQQSQIKKLKEYKTTLINSAVTGKIKVSTNAKVMP